MEKFKYEIEIIEGHDWPELKKNMNEFYNNMKSMESSYGLFRIFNIHYFIDQEQIPSKIEPGKVSIKQTYKALIHFYLINN